MRTTPGEAKSPKVERIPEDVQAPMRNRLKMLRESLGITKTQVRCLSDSSLTNYEHHDLSTMRLGHIRQLAAEYGWSFAELIGYLVGREAGEIEQEARAIRRVGTYMRSMSPETAELACEILRKLVDFDAERGQGKYARGAAAPRARDEIAARVRVVTDDE